MCLQINTIYFLQSIWECVDELGTTSLERGCSLARTLSTVLLLLSLMTSTAQLGLKAATLQMLKLNWKELEVLVSERTALLRSLEESNPPDAADSMMAAVQVDDSTASPRSNKVAPLTMPVASEPRFDRIIQDA
jgi:hypothetical protein